LALSVALLLFALPAHALEAPPTLENPTIIEDTCDGFTINKMFGADEDVLIIFPVARVCTNGIIIRGGRSKWALTQCPLLVKRRH